MSTRHFDIVIVGGGMVGASLACALDGYRVAVVESFALLSDAQEPAYQPSFDARSTALSLSSVHFLEQLGLWQSVQAHAQAIGRIHVSDRGRFGSTRMDAAQEKLAALGYVVENQWLGSVLHRAMRERTGLEVFAPARVSALRPGVGAGVQLQVEAPAGCFELQAGLAVVADGARSTLAAQLGIAMEQRACEQHALIANIGHGAAHEGRAFERFSEQGPLAMLPLPPCPEGGPRSALVWVLPPQLASETASLNEHEFLGRLQTRFGYRLGRLQRCGERQLYPLSLSQASEQVRAGVVLLGNSAHTLHPVAGQGFNLSLRDVATLARMLHGARARDEPPGSLGLLQQFVATQRADQQLTAGFSDALPRVFGSGLLPLASARDLGLIGLDLFPRARSALVRHATGLAAG